MGLEETKLKYETKGVKNTFFFFFFLKSRVNYMLQRDYTCSTNNFTGHEYQTRNPGNKPREMNWLSIAIQHTKVCKW